MGLFLNLFNKPKGIPAKDVGFTGAVDFDPEAEEKFAATLARAQMLSADPEGIPTKTDAEPYSGDIYEGDGKHDAYQKRMSIHVRREILRAHRL